MILTLVKFWDLVPVKCLKKKTFLKRVPSDSVSLTETHLFLKMKKKSNIRHKLIIVYYLRVAFSCGLGASVTSIVLTAIAATELRILKGQPSCCYTGNIYSEGQCSSNFKVRLNFRKYEKEKKWSYQDQISSGMTPVFINRSGQFCDRQGKVLKAQIPVNFVRG